MRIAMWSGPRNLSTAMMYAFASRSDTAVVDEPFYAAYLKQSGVKHPMQAEILASQSIDPNTVITQCLTMPPDKPIYYQKHMTQHMLENVPLDWLAKMANVFLIRHPARVVASYQKKREDPSLTDIGFVRQCELYTLVKEQTGKQPIVIDSDDILNDPASMISKLCEAIGIEYQAQMLTWPKGGNDADGVWAPHWYASVWNSTGLEKAMAKPLPELEGELAEVCEQAMPYYQAMSEYKLKLA